MTLLRERLGLSYIDGMASQSVLIVDDDPDVLRLLERALTPSGYSVSTAGSVTEAITALEARKFDAVITDKNMPGESGLDLIDGLRVRYPSMAVLLMTAFPEGGLNKLPIDGYLPKPFRSLDAVRETLQRALERRAAQGERQQLRDTLESVKAELQRVPEVVTVRNK